jgi:hypothetical protein
MRHRHLQRPERRLVHARHAHALQRRHAQAADEQLLPAATEGRQHQRHLRHVEAVRADQPERRRHRPQHTQPARHRQLHQRHQRHQQRHCAHAARVQRHGPLRGPGRRQAQGQLRHLPGALACRHRRLPGPEEEPRQGGDARPRPLLRAVDPGPLHEARGAERRLDADVPQRMPGPRR